ncbi:DMT family transporter [Planomonospora corallina]|uniref:DMT family transporter n=1 Tax=Planomonospora corallina TaxID=1806052 RepID=A0ABV8I8M0_9ACTN
MFLKSSRAGVDLMLLLVAAVWGSTYLVAKGIVTPATVVAVLALRFLVTAVAMLPACLSRLSRVTRGEVGTGVTLGSVLAAVFFFETSGIAHTSATNAGLVISLTMVLTPMLDSVVSRSPLPPGFFAAAGTAVIGVWLLASGTGLRTPSAGDALILVAAALRAVHVTVMHRMSAGKEYDSLNLTYVQMATVAVLFCLASPFSGSSVFSLLPAFGPAQWSALLYLAVVGTVFAFFVQMWAVRSTSPSRVSLLLGTEPVWALVVGVLLGGDRMGVDDVIGAGLILAGVGWGRRVERRHGEPGEKPRPVGGLPGGRDAISAADRS